MNTTKTKVQGLMYIRLYVKARSMLIDAGRYDDVAELERLYQELLGDAS